MLPFIVSVLHFMLLYPIQKEKPSKNSFQFKMAPEFKMEAENCFRQSVSMWTKIWWLKIETFYIIRQYRLLESPGVKVSIVNPTLHVGTPENHLF
jgi:hypothetical protein